MHTQARKQSLFPTLDVPATPKEAYNNLREQPHLSESQMAEESHWARGAVQETFFTTVPKKAGQDHSIPKCPWKCTDGQASGVLLSSISSVTQCSTTALSQHQHFTSQSLLPQVTWNTQPHAQCTCTHAYGLTRKNKSTEIQEII